MITEPATEGWGDIRPLERRAHYYRDSGSLCGRVGFYAGPLETVDRPMPGTHCAACRNALTRAAKRGRTRMDNPPAAGAPKGWRWGYLPCGCRNDGHGEHVL